MKPNNNSSQPITRTNNNSTQLSVLPLSPVGREKRASLVLTVEYWACSVPCAGETHGGTLGVCGRKVGLTFFPPSSRLTDFFYLFPPLSPRSVSGTFFC